MEFFTEKIRVIRKNFIHTIEPVENLNIVNKFDTFRPADIDELKQIIHTFGIRTSPAETASSHVLKGNIAVFLPIWLELVNLSLSTGSFDCLKSAVVLPLIKCLDASIDTELFKNYRPVSNLVFVSKLIERCVATRLNEHLENNNLHNPHQFGYKKNHSMEFLLTKIVNNILLAFDNKLATTLLLLDLSAAFDTVDQNKLLSILHKDIGITGVAYQWFVSFLKGRSQRVKIGDCYSEMSSLLYGVAQGSVLGPILFNIYMHRFYPEMQCLHFDVDGFADDHQLYKHFDPMFQCQVLIFSINNCMNVVRKWMSEFCLCLNANKTKIMVLAPPSILSNIIVHGTFIQNTCIRFVNCAKNLGVWLDENLSFQNQISKTVSSCFLSLRAIGKIKCFIPNDMLQTVLVSLIFSKIDYCNSLYYGIGENQLRKLQSVQNTAARMITGGTKYDRKHISPVLKKLHWLPVKDRIIFKYALLVHKCIWQDAPESLKALLL